MRRFGNPKDLAAELFRACAHEMAGDLDEAGIKAAYWLFAELNQKIGRSAARRAFWQFAKPATATLAKKIDNHHLLHRLDTMRDESGKLAPNKLRLAKQIVAENLLLTPQERKNLGTAGSISETSLEKHIRDVARSRERALKAGTWYGPISEEQAIRHFGLQKVETFSEKR